MENGKSEHISYEAVQSIEYHEDDSTEYIVRTVAEMKDAAIIADIVRQNPTYFPGSSYYEQNLTSGNNLEDSQSMQQWLDSFSGNYFAALSLALQRPYAEEVAVVIATNQELFQGAAHIMAAWHDRVVSRKAQQDPSFDKESAFVHYRAAFVDDFREMIAQQVEEAQWIVLESPNDAR